jgi:hypothetical protein
MRKRNVIFIVVFLLLLTISLIVYFLFLKKSKDLARPKSTDSRSEIIWKLSNERTEVIESGGYPKPLRDYLDTLYGKERFEWDGDRDQTLLHITAQYPDERGSVLFALYVAYTMYLEDAEALELDKSRSNWEKLEKRNQIRDHYFHGKLGDILFPPHPSQKPLEFLYYAEDYIEKHPYTYAAERKRHFQKKRNQIYSDAPLDIRRWEDVTFQKKILSLIFQREMSLMTELEKSQFLESKLREEEDGHFWN